MTHWLYPANTKFYDVSGAMAQPETFWPMRSQTAVGDRVFIYLAAPHKQIGYACDVTETGIDEASVRETLVAQLGTMGARVDSAGNVPEALRLVTSNKYDALIVDIRMPGSTVKGDRPRLISGIFTSPR